MSNRSFCVGRGADARFRPYRRWLQQNNITGTIPSIIGSMGNLLSLCVVAPYGCNPRSRMTLARSRRSLARNRLTGTIPRELGSLRSLELM